MSDTDIKSWTEPEAPRAGGGGAGMSSVRVFLVQVRPELYPLNTQRLKPPKA